MDRQTLFEQAVKLQSLGNLTQAEEMFRQLIEADAKMPYLYWIR